MVISLKKSVDFDWLKQKIKWWYRNLGLKTAIFIVKLYFFIEKTTEFGENSIFLADNARFL